MRETGPRVVLYEENGKTKISFTPDEAEMIIGAFVAALRISGGQGEDS
jgi:hypothetical protein